MKFGTNFQTDSPFWLNRSRHVPPSRCWNVRDLSPTAPNRNGRLEGTISLSLEVLASLPSSIQSVSSKQERCAIRINTQMMTLSLNSRYLLILIVDNFFFFFIDFQPFCFFFSSNVDRLRMNFAKACRVVVMKSAGQRSRKKANGGRASPFSFRLDSTYSNGRRWVFLVVIRRNRYSSNRSKSAAWLIQPFRRVALPVVMELTHRAHALVSAKIAQLTLIQAEGPLSVLGVTSRLHTLRRAAEDVTNDPHAPKMTILK